MGADPLRRTNHVGGQVAPSLVLAAVSILFVLGTGAQGRPAEPGLVLGLLVGLAAEWIFLGRLPFIRE